jgi:hypothetical protein
MASSHGSPRLVRPDGTITTGSKQCQNIRDFAKSSIEETSRFYFEHWDDDSPHFELYQRGIAMLPNTLGQAINEQVHEIRAFRQLTFGPELVSEELALSICLKSQ